MAIVDKCSEATFRLTRKDEAEFIDVSHLPYRRFDELGGGPTTYVVSFPRMFEEVRCPVPGCPAVAHIAGRLRKHFMY